MKPQLLLQVMSTEGAHNAAPERTHTRLKKSAAWKRQRIIRLKPADALIPTKVAETHESLIYPPNNGVARLLAVGVEVGKAYSQAIENVLAHPELSTWEYILTLEADNMPPPEGVLRLVARMEANPRLSCVGGLYYTKGYDGVPQIWGDPKDPVLNFRPQMPDFGGGLVECCGTGMGFNLWRLEMFKDKRLRRPWFITQTEGGVSTQDLYFWTDARKYGYRCAVDCGVKVGHYDVSADMAW
jgi:hypothetical protein